MKPWYFLAIIRPSRAVRDQGLEKRMTDPRMHVDVNSMLFDGKRATLGGFETIVEE